MLALTGSAWRSSLAQCSHRAGLPVGGGGGTGGGGYSGVKLRGMIT